MISKTNLARAKNKLKISNSSIGITSSRMAVPIVDTATREVSKVKLLNCDNQIYKSLICVDKESIGKTNKVP